MQNVGKKREKKKTNEERVFKSKWVIDGPSNESERERVSREKKKKKKERKKRLEFLRKRNERRLQPCYYHFLPHFARCLEKFFLFATKG